MNGRATRTTHPKTIHLSSKTLFQEVIGRKLTIETLFYGITKADVLERLGKSSQRHSNSERCSCSKTFLNLEQASHCGGCSQCIDRRIATYAAGLAETDEPDVYCSTTSSTKPLPKVRSEQRFLITSARRVISLNGIQTIFARAAK